MGGSAGVPAGFVRLDEGSRYGFFRRGEGERLAGLGALDPPRFAAGGERIGTVRGRIEHPVVRAGGLEVVVKAYRRGGMIGGLLGDRYAGAGRFIGELEMYDRASRNGLPLVEVLGLVVERRGGFARAWEYSRWIPGARELWDAIKDASAEEAAARVEEAGGLARALAEAGIEHTDLSARNILAAPDGLRILDLDRARRLRGSIAAGLAPLARLRRSLAKLAHLEGRTFDPAWDGALARGYAGTERDLAEEALARLRTAARRQWIHAISWRGR
ncbi:MAG: hypothetical protein JXP34_13980 [Planctomycetes bacterium]|nr:hypothetical protein [Planctomycetota bacterium]